MAAAPVGQLGTLHGALLRSVAAAGAEGAAGGHIEGAGNVALENYAVLFAGGLGVGYGYRGKQGLGVGVLWIGHKLVGIRKLHYVAQIHYRYAVGNMLYDQQIMCDEEVCNAQLVLQILEHVDDLRLNGYVQCGDRLVADYELGIHGECPGYAYTLALAA